MDNDCSLTPFLVGSKLFTKFSHNIIVSFSFSVLCPFYVFLFLLNRLFMSIGLFALIWHFCFVSLSHVILIWPVIYQKCLKEISCICLNSKKLKILSLRNELHLVAVPAVGICFLFRFVWILICYIFTMYNYNNIIIIIQKLNSIAHGLIK